MIPFPCVRVPKSSSLEFQRSDSLPCSFWRKQMKKQDDDDDEDDEVGS